VLRSLEFKLCFQGTFHLNILDRRIREQENRVPYLTFSKMQRRDDLPQNRRLHFNRLDAVISHRIIYK
jgi:hypothetical protein